MTNNYASSIDIGRDVEDIRNFHMAKRMGIPLFGVCRGHQFLNAMSGGKLTQHITSYHPKWHTLSSGELVNSYHHQGVISTPLEVISMYQNIIEITKGDKIFSVQFHPEFDQLAEMDEIIKEGLNELCL